MSVVSLIARRDLAELLRSGRLYWTGGLMVVLVLTALAVGRQRQGELRAERTRAQALDYADWLRQPERHPHDAAHQGMHVFKAEAALSIVDPGIGPYVGSTLWLRAHRQTEVKFRPAADATGLQRFGSLSTAWVVQMLGPLLVIVLGFGAISAEREQGTLRQLLALGVPLRRIFWGKAWALAATLACLLAPLALVAGVAVIWAAEPGTRADTLARLFFLAVGYVVYLGSFIFIVLAVSLLAQSSRLSLVCLLGLWIATSLVAPRMISDLSRSWIPSETRREFNQRLDAALSAETQRAWTKQFGVGTPFGSDVPLSQWGIGLHVHDQAGYGVMDQHFDALWGSYARQQVLQEWASILTPTVAVRAFSMGVAGTDFDEHRGFSTAAEGHRRRMQDVLSQDLVEHADGHGEQHFSYRAAPELWAKVPPFEHRPASALLAVRRNLRSLAMLCAGLLLSVFLARTAVWARPMG
jgi:ABC-2 type transport system permease protein